MRALNSIKELIVEPTKRFGTAYMHEDGEFQMPFDQVEEYQVLYNGLLVANFWVSNNFRSSIALHTPVDLDILDWILEQIKIREFA